jgi:uncharacterized coiled-coil protein SlyX
MGGDESERLRKVEESLAFTDHAIEQLSTEIAVLGRRVAEAMAALRRLEARLDATPKPPEPGEDG